MAYYTRDNLPDEPLLGQRRPAINEFFLSSYTMGIYAGCEIGCPYCDGWAFSPRPLNETVHVPIDMPQRIAAELADIDRGDLIGITALSDPYQPAEQHYRITRQILQLFAEVGQPCLVLTKSPTVLEDLPILQKINERSLAVVMTTLVTVDPHLAEKIERRAPPPALRLETLATLKRAGIPVGVALAPVMPYVNDSDYAVSGLLRACAAIGVDFVVWDYLHIPNERHYARINEIVARVGSYPASYYRDIYRGQPLVSAAYRSERDEVLLTRFDGLGIEARAPHRLYAGKLRPANEAALLLKHTAFRDRAQGREHLAREHRALADRIYRGEATQADLRQSALGPVLAEILAR